MLYPWLDWQRASLSAWLDVARLAAAATPLGSALEPPRELLARTLAAGAVGERPLEAVVRQDAPFPVHGEAIAETAFVRLIRLRRQGPRQRRRFLVLAPHSGYATAVISPLVTALAALGEVVATDWVDARLVPRAKGGFGLAEQVAVGLEAAAALGGPAHLVALSQSGPAAVAVAALLAGRTPQLAPASLAFLGCQLDPAARHTPLQRLLARWPRQLLAASLTTEVGAGHPGAGRRVYPSVLQLIAYSVASPELYADVQRGLWRELAAGQPGAYGRQHADLHSLLDVPAELFLETLDWLLGEAPWDRDRPIVGGTAHDLAPLRRLPLLTVESELDELVGRGQTHAFRRRLGGAARASAVTLPGGRHHDLFTGPGFLAGVAPVLRGFYAERAS